eukprot:GHVT01069918.1.p1 GENE.GHVT01069918.1~~GHVT01069918.1.p1  ORF type:complete len:488 (-),score=27.57 GHVT01069918.1:1492-2955(-)
MSFQSLQNEDQRQFSGFPSSSIGPSSDFIEPISYRNRPSGLPPADAPTILGTPQPLPAPLPFPQSRHSQEGSPNHRLDYAGNPHPGRNHVAPASYNQFYSSPPQEIVPPRMNFLTTDLAYAQNINGWFCVHNLHATNRYMVFMDDGGEYHWYTAYQFTPTSKRDKSFRISPDMVKPAYFRSKYLKMHFSPIKEYDVESEALKKYFAPMEEREVQSRRFGFPSEPDGAGSAIFGFPSEPNGASSAIVWDGAPLCATIQKNPISLENYCWNWHRGCLPCRSSLNWPQARLNEIIKQRAPPRTECRSMWTPIRGRNYRHRRRLSPLLSILRRLPQGAQKLRVVNRRGEKLLCYDVEASDDDEDTNATTRPYHVPASPGTRIDFGVDKAPLTPRAPIVRKSEYVSQCKSKAPSACTAIATKVLASVSLAAGLAVVCHNVCSTGPKQRLLTRASDSGTGLKTLQQLPATQEADGNHLPRTPKFECKRRHKTD